MEYLNNAACAQAVVKAPIVMTLLAFDEIESVQWEIDGEVVTEWDA